MKGKQVKSLQKYCLCLSKVLEFKVWIKEMLSSLDPDWEKYLRTESDVKAFLRNTIDLIPKTIKEEGK